MTYLRSSPHCFSGTLRSGRRFDAVDASCAPASQVKINAVALITSVPKSLITNSPQLPGCGCLERRRTAVKRKAGKWTKVEYRLALMLGWESVSSLRGRRLYERCRTANQMAANLNMRPGCLSL